MTTPQGVGTIVKQMLATEGPRAFYKGTLPPLLGVGACVSIQFGVNANTQRAIKRYNKGEDLSLKQHFVAGGISGLANTIISSPAEGMRIIMQT